MQLQHIAGFELRTLSCLVLATLALSGCQPSASEGPAGQISLRYIGVSHSKFRFVLDNRTDHTIYLHGSKRFGEDFSPWNSDFVCKTINGGLSGSSFLGDAQLPAKQISISRDEQLSIGFDRTFISVTGNCKLELHLPSGVNIQSNEFRI